MTNLLLAKISTVYNNYTFLLWFYVAPTLYFTSSRELSSCMDCQYPELDYLFRLYLCPRIFCTLWSSGGCRKSYPERLCKAVLG